MPGFFTHQRILLINANADKQDGDDLATLIFYRLILCDVAMAEQRRQSLIDVALTDAFPGGAVAVKLRTDRATAILLFQRGGNTDKIIAVAYKNGRHSGGAFCEIVYRGLVEFSVFNPARSTGVEKAPTCTREPSSRLKRLGRKLVNRLV